jgi:hypothetical protein
MSKEELERIRKEYTSQLKPLLNSVRDRDSNPQDRKIFRENCLELGARTRKIRQIYDYMAQRVDVLSEELAAAEESSVRYFFSLAFFYLGLVEITGNFLADFAIAHLIATGHDFHVECAYRTPRIKHVIYMKELEEERVPLATKLNFIEDCGITIFKSFIDTKLRNDIAHMNFDIKDNIVYIRGKPAMNMITNSLAKMATVYDEHDRLIKEVSLDLNARMDFMRKAMSNRKPKKQ